LGRDRTKHQVAEVTSLGLVQMTRKRIGTGLLEAFSETCDHCHGRGVVVHSEPVEPKKADEADRSRHRGGGRTGRKQRKNTKDKSDEKPKDKSEDQTDKTKASSAPALTSEGGAVVN